ncbi:MAG TPA: arginine--tRNA ligase [Solirubrobacteraceae bacterium]|nr:arginine--tRNA ligase [Solirubrobacteraceae bacterium]
METPLTQLRAAVRAASGAVAGDNGAPRAVPTLERPKKAGFGDYATNAAMLLAPLAGAPPREVAAKLAEELGVQLGPALDRVEVAGPGFLNLFLSDAWCVQALDHVLAAGDAFGGGGADPAERINVEYVSANPTGPPTAASGRHGAFGDALVRLLRFRGHDVGAEYYFNDAGTQIDKLGASILARARGEEVPEGGYEGDYVRELAEQIPGAAELEPSELARRGVELMFERIKGVLRRYRVEFDVFFSEAQLHDGEPSAITRVFERLDAAGRLYRADGALWLRTTEFGDDKDRVLVRSSGQTTYFAADVAYLADKLERGFDRLVLPLGADHHGYLGRMRAGLAALGADPDCLEMPILQFVHVIERGERSKMSKRRGDFVTLEELIETIGVDATRYFMLQRSHDTMVDLDLDLACEQSSENPVYYVQYAHARIASILAKAGEERVAAALAQASSLTVALEPSERTLIKKLLAFGEEVEEAAARRAPHRVTAYVLELAQTFTAFYRDCQVLGAEGEGVESFRLALGVAAQRTIARALDLLGVEAPQAM